MRSDQYRLVCTRDWVGSGYSFLAGRSGTPALRYLTLREVHSDQWIPADSSWDWLLVQRHTGRRRWLVGSEERARADGIDLDRNHLDRRAQAPFGDYLAEDEGRASQPRLGGWTIPDAAFLAVLPREPDQLVAQLEAAHPRTRFAGPLTHAAQMLRSCLFPAELRTALYGGLLGLPEISLVEDTTDQNGNDRIGLTCELNNTRHELLIDPDTGHYAGQRDTAMPGSQLPVEPGTIVSTSRTLTTIVDALDEFPTLGALDDKSH